MVRIEIIHIKFLRKNNFAITLSLSYLVRDYHTLCDFFADCILYPTSSFPSIIAYSPHNIPPNKHVVLVYLPVNVITAWVREVIITS